MVLALLVVALAGCDRTDLFVYSCPQPDEDYKDANGEPDPCHRNDPTASDAGVDDAGGTCDGVCVPHIPLGWGDPALVWMGAEADAPLCSAIVGDPGEHFTGHADLDAPILCGACTCDPPSGSCALPATLTASAATCAGDGPGVPHTPFNPPPKWDGTCTAANATPAGKLCNGVPCVQSVTIAPLTLSQSGCLPIEPVNVQPPPTWKTFARACVRDTFAGNCAKENEVCAPRSSRPDFKVCALKEGDPIKLECPAGYPDRSVFYQSFLDVRSCSPCTCGAPIGSTCTGSITIFQDGACTMPLVASASIDAKGSKCLDLSSGAPLLSKSASPLPTFTAGTCVAEGGEPDQKALPDIATVICCLGAP